MFPGPTDKTRRPRGRGPVRRNRNLTAIVFIGQIINVLAARVIRYRFPAGHVTRCCQLNAGQSPKGLTQSPSGRQLTPLGRGGGVHLLEGVAAVQVAVLVEVIADLGVGGGVLPVSVWWRKQSRANPSPQKFPDKPQFTGKNHEKTGKSRLSVRFFNAFSISCG